MTFHDPTPTRSIPDAIVGNPPYGKYYVPDSQLTPRQRAVRGIAHVADTLEKAAQQLRLLAEETGP